MEKIILRKDYKTRVVPVEEAVGHYLTKMAARTWTEEFVDESTKETVKNRPLRGVAGERKTYHRQVG